MGGRLRAALWCTLLGRTGAPDATMQIPTLEAARAEARVVVDALPPLRGWQSCAPGIEGEHCRARASYDLVATVATDPGALASWCWTTCANATAGAAFDCSHATNALDTRPATIVCGAGMCSAAECCTVVPLSDARAQFAHALADPPPSSEWLAVSSSIVFEVDIVQLEGTDARSEFEEGFKEAMARSLGEKTLPFEPFMHKHDLFTKTGSGQTLGKLKTRGVFLR